jgi:hypothetical protein
MGHKLRLVGLATLAVLASAGLAVGGASGAQAHPGQPGSVFDLDQVSWASLRDRTSAQFGADLANMRDQGFMPVDVDSEGSANGARHAGVYQRNTDDREWAVQFDLTSAAYGMAWSSFASLGLRLVDFETYVINDVRLFTGYWVENVEGYGWTSSRNMTLADFINFSNNSRDAGRMLIDIDVYETGAGLRYAAASVRNDDGLDWRVDVGLSAVGYNTLLGNVNPEMRPLAAMSYQSGGVQRYAVILVENANGRDHAEEQDLTSAAFGLVWSAYADAGFRLVGFDRYSTAAGVRYIGIWRQND